MVSLTAPIVLLNFHLLPAEHVCILLAALMFFLDHYIVVSCVVDVCCVVQSATRSR